METPIFTLIRFNTRRAARGAEAAEVNVKWVDGEAITVWMSLSDIKNNAKEYGWQGGLQQARHHYLNNKEYPVNE
jgi:hypothetical protein